MKYLSTKLAIAAVVGAGVALSGVVAEAAPKKGGTLNYVVGSKIPSYDAHVGNDFRDDSPDPSVLLDSDSR